MQKGLERVRGRSGGRRFLKKKGGKKKKSVCPLSSCPPHRLVPSSHPLSRFFLFLHFFRACFFLHASLPPSSLILLIINRTIFFFCSFIFFFFIFVFIPHQVKKAFFSCSPVSRSCLKSISLKNAWLNYPLFSSPKFNSMNLLFA